MRPSKSGLFYELKLVLVRYFFAVTALKGYFIPFRNRECRRYGLVVCHALGIGAPYESVNFARDRNLPLFGNFKIFYKIDHSHRCEERYAVQFLFSAPAVVDLYDRLSAHPFALKVVAKRYAVGLLVELEDVYNLEEILRRDMVYDCSIFYSPYFH